MTSSLERLPGEPLPGDRPRGPAVKVDCTLGYDPSVARGPAEAARRAEELGYDGVWSVETGHDPFLPLVQAAGPTSRIELGTGIAVAFARNPMNLAVLANDLQAISEGRFLLGLGSQIKPHVTKRYSMPWSKPAARMRELIQAVRAIWACWADPEVGLRFRGEFYTHTLMTPFFDPGPNRFGNPPILLAAVGELMTEVAGEVADGLFVHAFTTERYLRQVTLPALERGAARGGRSRTDLQVSYGGFVVTGRDEREMDRMAAGVRQQIAFYGSTPAYRGVFELHGWHDLHPRLSALSKQGEWEAMGRLIDDEVLDAFAVVAPPEEIPERLRSRFGGLVDRMTVGLPGSLGTEVSARLLSDLRGA